MIIDCIATCAAVNCYAMASGYLLFKSKCEFKKLVSLWCQVEFYSVVLFIVLGIKSDVGIKEMISSLFPVLRNQYWYFTAYIVVFLLAPFINKMLLSLSDYEWKKLLLVLFIIFQ